MVLYELMLWETGIKVAPIGDNALSLNTAKILISQKF